jgi:integrase
VQFKHYDGRDLTVFGKGGKVRYLPIVDRDLRMELERHILDRGPSPEQFLLYPEKLGPEFYGGPLGRSGRTPRSNCPRPPCIAGGRNASGRAGIAHRPMHEARHTAITDFLRRTGNLKLAQMLAGQAEIGTTANIYSHLDTSDLETALRTLNEEPS